MSDRLGGAVQRQPLDLVFVLDVSGSMMRGGRIQALNNALTEVLPHLRDEARANPHAQLRVRALTFADVPRWVVEQPTPVERLQWTPVPAVPRGLTELGEALRVLAATLDPAPGSGAPDSSSGYPPAIVLVSDGRPTDAGPTSFDAGLDLLLAGRRGAGAVRLALGVGRDADLASLRRFIGDDDIPLLRGDDPQQLAEHVAWASRTATQLARRQEGLGPF